MAWGTSGGRVPISKAGTRPEATFSGKSISSSFPPLPDEDTPSHAPNSAYAQPPISGACAPGPSRGWSQSEGLVSLSFLSLPYLPRVSTAACRSRELRGRRVPTWAVSHAVSAQGLPPSPRRRPAPSRLRPRPLRRPGLPQPPHPLLPFPARPGGRDLVLQGSFR